LSASIHLYFEKHSNAEIICLKAQDLSSLIQDFDGSSSSFSSALLSVGTNKLPTPEVLDLLRAYPNRVILTQSAYYAVSEYFKIIDPPIKRGEEFIFLTSFDGVDDKFNSNTKNFKEVNLQSNLLEISMESYPPEWVYKKFTKTWLRDYLMQNPDHALDLEEAKIVDDISYQVNEVNLPKELRLELGYHRFQFLSEFLPKGRLVENYIPLFPPWVYVAEVAEYLPLDVRCHNCLKSISICFFYDFFKISEKLLLTTTNYGKRSHDLLLADLEHGIKDFKKHVGFVKEIFDAQYPYLNSFDYLNNDPNGEFVDIFEENDFNDSEEVQHEITKTLFESFFLYRDTTLNKKSYKDVFSYRLGLTGKPKTLQEVAEILGVTRQWISQIEKKILLKFSQKFNVADILLKKIHSIRIGLQIPLTVETLSSYDPWFVGIEDKPWLLSSMFSTFKLDDYRVHNFDGQHIIAPGESEFIELAIKSTKEFIVDKFKEGLYKSDIQQFVSNLIGVITPELVDIVLYECTKNVTFDINGKDPKVMFVGSKLNASIASILSNSETPLNCTEIARLLKERFDYDVEINYVRNACNTSFYAFAPSTFGLIHHLPFSKQEISSLCDLSYDHIIENGASKQWHCERILEAILDTDPSLERRLTKYGVRICLSTSDRFQYLGRMVFALNNPDESNGTSKRIEFAQFVEAVLDKSPVPMKREDIYEIIERDRGLGSAAQIFNSGRLVSIDVATWALMDKHLHIAESEFQAIVTEIVDILKSKGHGITEMELLECLSSNSAANRFKSNPYLLFSLGVKSKLCKKEDIFLYLSEWDDCRRITAREASLEAITKIPSSGIKMKDLMEIASNIYGHAMLRSALASALVDNNYSYDEVLQTWTKNQ
jgi:hypothetical protein